MSTVVARYREQVAIDSWQLENEALLSNFGSQIDIDRERLRAEYAVIRRLDAQRPIVMSTSNGWGIPVRAPRPDVVGFSWYFRRHNKGTYKNTIQFPWLYAFRRHLVHVLLGKKVFIHELQLEPWGPEPIWKMTSEEQAKSMDAAQIQHNLKVAQKSGMHPIDIWGAEWWYWRHTQGDDTIWQAVKDNLV